MPVLEASLPSINARSALCRRASLRRLKSAATSRISCHLGDWRGILSTNDGTKDETAGGTGGTGGAGGTGGTSGTSGEPWELISG